MKYLSVRHVLDLQSNSSHHDKHVCLRDRIYTYNVTYVYHQWTGQIPRNMSTSLYTAITSVQQLRYWDWLLTMVIIKNEIAWPHTNYPSAFCFICGSCRAQDSIYVIPKNRIRGFECLGNKYLEYCCDLCIDQLVDKV